MKVTARAERSGGWWAITVPEVSGVYTQARRLDQVEAMARSAVEDLLEIDGSTLDVTLDVQLSVLERRLVADAKSKLAFSEYAARVAALANREAVLGLRGSGMTTREAATALGISAGRVSQIEARAQSVQSLEWETVPDQVKLVSDLTKNDVASGRQDAMPEAEWAQAISRLFTEHAAQDSRPESIS